MPRIGTKYFGVLEYREEQVVRFPFGLPAFEEEIRFLLIAPGDRAPLVFLQSFGRPDLCFLALPILAIDPDYRLEMTVEDLESLKLDERRQPTIGAEVDCLALVVAPDHGSPTANLSVPIVINRENGLGAQAIRLDSVYSHQHSLIQPEDICS